MGPLKKQRIETKRPHHMGDPGNTVEKTYLKSTKNVNLTWNNCSETAALSDRGRGAVMPSSAFVEAMLLVSLLSKAVWQ